MTAGPRRRLLSSATAVAVFGGVVGLVLDRNDAWSKWFGVDIERSVAIATGALLGAVVGLLAGWHGGGDRGRYRNPPDAPGGGGDGGA